MVRFTICLFLGLMITALCACQSASDRQRTTRNRVCEAALVDGLPKTVRVARGELRAIDGEYYAPARRYNALVDHAAGLAACLTQEQCLRALTEWERDCAETAVADYAQSYLPGAFRPRLRCAIPRPLCSI